LKRRHHCDGAVFVCGDYIAGWAKAQSAVPTIDPRWHQKWWARFALPTLEHDPEEVKRFSERIMFKQRAKAR
jgi:hypothetical protein